LKGKTIEKELSEKNKAWNDIYKKQ
jgi:hypothetical protein